MSLSSPIMLPEDVERRMVEHMNEDHQDAVLAYARHFGQRPQAEGATLLGINRREMRVMTDSEEALVIPLTEELAAPDDARRVLIEMVKQARAALGE